MARQPNESSTASEPSTIGFAAAIALAEIRAAGRGTVRRRLEVLVNTDILGLAGAQKVWRDAFGGELIGVKASKPRWFQR